MTPAIPRTPSRLLLRLLAGIFAAVLLTGCMTAPPLDAAQRPGKWAASLAVNGLENLHKVDDNLYRSRQPGEAGMQAAREQLGIRTVVNLRAFHSDRKLAEQAGVNSVDLGLVAWDIDDEEVVAVLRTLRQREQGPFLLHCQHGADRTGVMTAMYRIIEQGWTREEALDEMLHGGFGFHTIWFNIVDYLEHVDIERIRAQLDAPLP